jgi:Tol biopolymer transport system component
LEKLLYNVIVNLSKSLSLPYFLCLKVSARTINVDGTQETRLTSTGYAQGLASWSHSGDRMVYGVAAIGEAGKYDMYMMNADGSENHDVTPGYFAANFLCHSPIFSQDDLEIYFIGEGTSRSGGLEKVAGFSSFFRLFIEA